MANWLSNIFNFGWGLGGGRSLGYLNTGSQSSAGIHVTSDNMLTHSAVHEAVYVLASGIGGVDLNVFAYLPNGGKVIDWEHPYQELIAVQPNEDMSARAMREVCMVHLLTRGNAFILIWRNRLGQPVALYMLDPAIVQPLWDGNGTLYYAVAGQRVEKSEIIHVAAPGLNGVIGLSPVHHLRNLVGVAQALDEFAGSFFSNGCNARGILSTEGELSDLAQRRLRKSFKRKHAGASKGNDLMILEEGMKFTPTSINPDECQFNETQKLILLKIANAFNLPPTKVGLYDHTALSTLEETNLDFFNSSLLPWVDRITDAFTLKLFPSRQERKTHGVEYKEGAGLRGRMQDRVAVWEKLKAMNVLNTNEIRAELGLPPIPNGDVYMVQANNYQPLDHVVSQGGTNPISANVESGDA